MPVGRGLPGSAPRGRGDGPLPTSFVVPTAILLQALSSPSKQPPAPGWFSSPPGPGGPGGPAGARMVPASVCVCQRGTNTPPAPRPARSRLVPLLPTQHTSMDVGVTRYPQAEGRRGTGRGEGRYPGGLSLRRGSARAGGEGSAPNPPGRGWAGASPGGCGLMQRCGADATGRPPGRTGPSAVFPVWVFLALTSGRSCCSPAGDEGAVERGARFTSVKRHQRPLPTFLSPPSLRPPLPLSRAKHRSPLQRGAAGHLFGRVRGKGLRAFLGWFAFFFNFSLYLLEQERCRTRASRGSLPWLSARSPHPAEPGTGVAELRTATSGGYWKRAWTLLPTGTRPQPRTSDLSLPRAAVPEAR